MSMLIDLTVVLSGSLPFREGWKRVRCMRAGHDRSKSVLVERQVFQKHPKNNGEVVYTVDLMRCDNCGLHYHDTGFSFRKGQA